MSDNNKEKAAVYFASGSNRPGEIRGFGEIRQPIGVVTPELLKKGEKTELARAELLNAAERDLPLFVDSGAFSEVDEKDADGKSCWPPRVVDPISHEEWLRRLELYVEIGDAYGPLLHAVAPDQVGYPAETLGRLSKYRREVSKVAATGAKILVVLQDGRDLAGFWRKVRLLLAGFVPEEQLVPSLPMKKNATPHEAVVEFARTAKPWALHLLGLGPNSQGYDVGRLLSDVAAVSPRTLVSHDSNLIRSAVGKRGTSQREWLKGESGKKNPRKYTGAQWEAADDLHYFAWREGTPAGAMGSAADYTDWVASPSAWITPKQSRTFADRLGLDAEEKKRWKKDPDAFLQEDVNGEGLARCELPEVAWELDLLWADYHHEATTPERKRRGIHRVFGPREVM